jgi:alkylation response protein AidB-like acyl-CoA dehydrogenase
MDFSLNEEMRRIQQLARDFAGAEIGPRAKGIDESNSFDRTLYRKLGDLGFTGMMLPDVYGGSGADNLSWCLVIEEIAKASSAIANSLVLSRSVGDLLVALGDERQREQYLPPLASGEAIYSFGLTEAGAGSDAAAIRTSARREGDEYILNGEKMFITLGLIADTVIVAATLDRQQGTDAIRTFLVPKGTPGFSRGEKLELMGIRGMETAPLFFDNCRIPARNVLGPESQGFKAFMRALDGGRLGIAAMATGLAQAALDLALEYSMQRVQFGQRIAEMQAVESMLADMSAEIDAARLLTHSAAWRRDAGLSHRKQASHAKLFASEICVRHVSNALQILGGYGYSKEYPIERFYRDAKIHQIWDGTSQIQRMIIGRHLRREFEEGTEHRSSGRPSTLERRGTGSPTTGPQFASRALSPGGVS